MARKQVIKPDFTINNMNAANNDPGVRTRTLPSFDFVLDFIRQQYGLMLAMNVSGNFLYDQARPGSESQYMVAASMMSARHPKVTKVIKQDHRFSISQQMLTF